ncbi:hypothetical protein AB0F46_39045 [Streptomyces sp. NPDC026665]|uniref:hypothetical protein n=1 Tax=Streptomyces sp. NPDC026665 TaxID=3154798 RepID=UPI0033DF0BFD
MTGRLCRTADEAFEAGWTELCTHDADPGECPECGLTDAEISRFVVLLGGLAEPANTTGRHAA